jgi:hypothetical protein
VRQAIADLGADVLKIAESLKGSRTAHDDGDAIPREMPQPRPRARAQP